MDYNFISKISGIQYNSNSRKSYFKFLDELKQNNLTLNEYCDKYLTNICHKKHLNVQILKENEHFYYKNIRLSCGTYEKIVVNDNFKCELCDNFFAASFPTFISHIKRFHHLSLYDYLIKAGYKDETPEIKYCAFCTHEAKYDIQYDIKTKTFKKIYPKLLCETEPCKDKICLEYFGKSYKDAIKEYEHIGGKTEFLCKVYNTTPEGLKQLGKSKCPKYGGVMKSTVDGFIAMYGEEEGIKRYNQRCKKSAYALSQDYYKEKYGENADQIFLDRMVNRGYGASSSKGQYKLYQLLDNSTNTYQLEHAINTEIVDIYHKLTNTVIEFYGDFWHANPVRYANDWIHPIMHQTALEIHDKDNKRINNIRKNLNNPKIIIVWENSFNSLSVDDIRQKIYTFMNNENNNGETLWI